MRLLPAIALLLLAVAMIVTATHLLCTDVLPFTDWTTASAPPATPTVTLP